MGESREAVETGYDEEEASLESEIPTVETNLQNPMSRAEQEGEYVDMLFTGIGVLFVSKVVVLGNVFNGMSSKKKDQAGVTC